MASIYKRKKDGAWHIQFRIGDVHRQKSLFTKDKSVAERKLAELELALSQPNVTLLPNFYDEILHKGVPRYEFARRKRLRIAFGIDDVKPELDMPAPILFPKEHIGFFHYHKASRKLQRRLLFNFACRLGMGSCYRCGKPLTLDDFTIDHKEPWLHEPDYFNKYFDVNNIAFSHLRCNSRASRGGSVTRVHWNSKKNNGFVPKKGKKDEANNSLIDSVRRLHPKRKLEDA